ncbi:regulator of chromosome condensation 1/beta-lactamase-inhibitor protein II, partial [Baffinella frigidus]
MKPAGAASRGCTAVAISASCAILDDGSVKCWGANSNGQLGLGDYENRGDDANGDRLSRCGNVDLGPNRTAVAVSAGGSHTCAVLDGGSLKCWGANSYGQLGLGDEKHRWDANVRGAEMGANLPAVDLGPGRTAVAVSAGVYHTCSILASAPAKSIDDGSVKCWGYNTGNTLGQGDTRKRGDDADEMGAYLPAVDLGPNRTAVALDVGDYHTCTILDDRSVKCWGVLNDHGQLGKGDVDFGPGRTAVALSAADKHSCAILDDKSIKCWGYNDAGNLGLGDDWDRGIFTKEMGANLPTVDLGPAECACPEGTILASGVDVLACTCKAGYNGTADGAACTPCTAGTYKVANGTGQCSACPA